jgi:hypothetical protein
MTKPYGFETEYGSIYGINDKGLTVRHKLSRGRGEGKIGKPKLCLYLPEETRSTFKKYYGSWKKM